MSNYGKAMQEAHNAVSDACGNRFELGYDAGYARAVARLREESKEQDALVRQRGFMDAADLLEKEASDD